MALLTCPECGKVISSMAESCPYCGCLIDKKIIGDNQQGLRSQEITVTKNQNRTRKSSLIAIWLCAIGTLLYIINTCYYQFVFDVNNVNSVRLLGISAIGKGLGMICIVIAWFLWLTRDTGKRYPALSISIVICVIMIATRVLQFIGSFIYPFFMDVYEQSNVVETLSISMYVLSIAFGFTLLLLKNQSKTKGLAIVVGTLYVISYLCSLLEVIYKPQTTATYAIGALLQLTMLTATIILYYNTYKQDHNQRLISNSPQSGLESKTKTTLLSVFAITLFSLLIWMVFIPHGISSKIYGEWTCKESGKTVCFSKDKKYEEYWMGESIKTGTFVVKGRDVQAEYSDDDGDWIIRFHLSDDNCLYSRVGNKYVKTQDY